MPDVPITLGRLGCILIQVVGLVDTYVAIVIVRGVGEGLTCSHFGAGGGGGASPAPSTGFRV